MKLVDGHGSFEPPDRDPLGDWVLVFAGRLPLLRSLRARGFSVVNFQTPRLYDKDTAALCEFTVLADLERSAVDLVRMALDIASTRNVLGAYSQNEYGMYAAAKTNEALHSKCPFNAAVSIWNTRDKAAFRNLIGYPNPFAYACRPWALCSSLEDVTAFLSTLGAAEGIIVKPQYGVGSLGVSHIQTRDDLSRLSFPHEECMVAEAYVVGSQYSVETFTFDGNHELLCINREVNSTDNDRNRFINMGHLLPVHLGSELQAAVVASVFDALTMLGISEGAAHTEVLIRAEQVFIIEVNPRPAGLPIPDLLEAAIGCSLLEMSLDWFLRKERPLVLTSRASGAAVKHFLLPPGRFVSVKGMDRAQQVKGILDISLKIAPGQAIEPLASSFDRVGYVSASADTADEAYARCCEAEALLQFDIDGVSQTA